MGRNSSDEAHTAGGQLNGTTATVTRLRTAREASQTVTLGGRPNLRTTLEIGIRQDGGDAETGAGVDVETGIAPRVSPGWGGDATSGTEALWGQDTMAGIGHERLPGELGSRLEGKIAYGMGPREPMGGELRESASDGRGTARTTGSGAA